MESIQSFFQGVGFNQLQAETVVSFFKPQELKKGDYFVQEGRVSQLQREITGFKDFYIGLLEWQICCIDKGKFDLITLTAEERYEKLLQEEPELLQQVPLRYIASMLAITPRHLSRLRAKK